MKLPYDTTIDDFNIIHDGNITNYTMESFEKITSNNGEYSVIFDSDYDINVQRKHICEATLTNLGSAGDSKIDYLKLFVRLSCYNKNIVVSGGYMPYTSRMTTQDIWVISSNTDDENVKNVKIVTRNNGGYVRTTTKVNFIYPKDEISIWRNSNELLTNEQFDILKSNALSSTQIQSIFGIGGDVESDLIPNKNNQISLGNASKTFRNVYCGRKLKIPFTSRSNFEADELDANAIIIIEPSTKKIYWYNNNDKKWYDAMGDEADI